MAGAVDDSTAAAAAVADKPKKRSSPDAADGSAPKAAKAPVDERAFEVSDSIKSLGQHVVRQQSAAASRISVVPGAASKLLCVITNDVLAAKRRMEENGNKELFIVSATLLQVFCAVPRPALLCCHAPPCSVAMPRLALLPDTPTSVPDTLCMRRRKVMEPAGFLNAPYEPAAHVPIKSRSFTDKDGKPLDSCKPVQLAQVTPPCLARAKISGSRWHP
jgi:hypothetical protein